MLQAYFRTVLLYALLIAVIRLMGKRQIGQMEASEFVVTMLVANLASIPMENPELPLHSGVIPILTVLILELLLAFLSTKSIQIRKLLCGKPEILIENGNVLQKSLQKNRITLDELTSMLREKDVLDLRSVQFAILETNGNLSVFPFPKERPATAKEAGIQVKKQFLPLAVVSDGKLMPDNLKKTGKDAAWVQKILAQHNAALQDTWLLTVDGSDKVVFYRKER